MMVQFSHTKIIFVPLLIVCAIACCIFILTLPIESQIRIKGGYFAWLGIPMLSGAAIFIWFPRLFTKKGALIISSEGITDNASGLRVGFVPWHDILSVDVFQFKRNKFLGFTIQNSEEYFSRISYLRLKLFKPIGNLPQLCIPQMMLAVPVSELLPQIQKHMQDNEMLTT